MRWLSSNFAKHELGSHTSKLRVLTRVAVTVTGLLWLGAVGCDQQSQQPQVPTSSAVPPTTQPAADAKDALSSMIQQVGDDATAMNQLCPVTSEKVTASGGRVEYQGMTVGFCCKDCIKSFTAEPAKFAAKLK